MVMNYLRFLLNAGSRSILRLSADVRGATALEYGLTIALLMLSIIGVVELIGSDLGSIFDRLSTVINDAS